MKNSTRFFCILCLFIFCSPAFSQDWKDYKLDSNVLLQVPSVVNVDNMMGRTIYSAQASTGACLFCVSPTDNMFRAANRTAMAKIYNELISGNLEGSNGELIDSSIIHNGQLEGRVIRTHVKINGIPVLDEIHFYLLQGRIYKFEFMQQESMYDSHDVEQKHFFDSIRFVTNSDAEAQFNDKTTLNASSPKNASPLAHFFEKIVAVALLVVGGIVIAIVLLVRKNKN